MWAILGRVKHTTFPVRTEKNNRLFTVLYFSVRSLSSTGCHILVSGCERNWGESKIPVDRGGGLNSVGWRDGNNRPCLRHLHPRALWTSHFRSHQETKMAVQRSTSTTARKNRGLNSLTATLFIIVKTNHRSKTGIKQEIWNENLKN